MPNIKRTHSTPDVVVGHAWPALLALTQANRDAAAALLLAMQTYGDPTGHAMQSGELHCWHTDAHDAAEVASQTADALKLLTTSDITGAFGTYDAGLKLGDNIDASITGAALEENSRHTNALDAAVCSGIAYDSPAQAAHDLR